MKKRILSFILVLVMTLGFLPTVPIANAATSGTCGDNLTWSFDEATGTLTIDGTGDMYDYDSIYGTYAPWYPIRDNITEVVIKEGVTSIGMEAFAFLKKLKNTTIPDSVVSVGQSAFYGCTNLITVIIGNGVTSIGSGTFYNCESLVNVILPENIKTINGYTFYSCKNLTSIIIPDKVTSISDSAFAYCINLTNINVPNSVVTIGDYSFQDCESLKEINLPNSITSIGTAAFSNCKSLKSITIPQNITLINKHTFSGCTNLNIVNIPESIEFIDECAFEDCESLKDSNDFVIVKNILFDYYGSDKNIIIPQGIKHISWRVFSNNSTITSVTIPKSVTSIGAFSFVGCSNLATVNYCGSEADKANITIGTSNDPLLNATWVYNYGSTPDPVISGTCGDNLTWSFDEATGTLTIDGTGDMYDYEIVFAGDGDTIIGIYDSDYPWFSFWRNITNVVIKESVTSISMAAFAGCRNLASVKISNSITSINQYTFSFCKNLTSIIVPDSVTIIDESAFYNCNSLTTVNYCGSENDRANITINESGNEPLLNATWVYDYVSTPTPTPTPTPHTHSFTNACDTTCNECDFVREITHDYKATFDANNHFDKCTVCGDTINVKAHAFDNACDNDCDCGFVRTTNHTFGEYVYNNDASEKADGTKTRTCSVCGHKETVTATGTKWKSSFIDIKTKDFYYKPTLWAVANGITTGTSKTEFSPEEPCTRGQVVTFLWRAAGCPEPTSTTMPFTDVGGKAFYKKAVLWAVEQGITSGTSATTFGPNETCTRGQIATFLWRAKGKPAPKSSNMPFVDVSAKNFAYKAVLWAVENKITSGTSKTTFAPSEPCTRGQIVTFLYRAYK